MFITVCWLACTLAPPGGRWQASDAGSTRAHCAGAVSGPLWRGRTNDSSGREICNDIPRLGRTSIISVRVSCAYLAGKLVPTSAFRYSERWPRAHQGQRAGKVSAEGCERACRAAPLPPDATRRKLYKDGARMCATNGSNRPNGRLTMVGWLQTRSISKWLARATRQLMLIWALKTPLMRLIWLIRVRRVLESTPSPAHGVCVYADDTRTRQCILLQ